jgi:hypothetical protein
VLRTEPESPVSQRDALTTRLNACPSALPAMKEFTFVKKKATYPILHRYVLGRGRPVVAL